ncbi:MAG: hypothetical protein B6U75_01700 [Desulfurococcales archaeon ex4484_217_1]|nr:MAG: hypothetical protein B6U75_01700 [Desulfurococcales archaeon ex4484_217_1]
MTRYNVIDLFCGAGGFSKGFYDLGFNIVLGLDNFEPVARTFKFNFSNSIVICEDIRNVYSDEILTYLKGKVPHIIIGSPPCEPFTAANPNRKESPLDRLYVDLQGQLTLEFIRIVKQLKPEIFIMENVPQIMENGLKKALIREFKDAGYNRVFFNILRAEDYGTPSHRIEQARLMGYPDNFVFLGGRDVQYNQVGESVPVPLSRSIAEVVLEYLTSRN